MFRLIVLSLSLALVGVQVSYAGPQEAEILERYNQDPSLLFDPSTYLDVPAEQREPANVSEAPAPEAQAPSSAVPEMPPIPEMELKKTEVKAEPESIPEKQQQAKAEGEKVEAAQPAPVVKKEEKVEAAQPAPVAKKDEKVADTSIALESEKQSVSSELVALPGVSDFSIIFSGDKFYPSVIRMKQNGNKNRLLFVSLGSKPAALVFVKPRIQRWISNESGNQATEEFREVNSSKITEIEFSAEPGNYEYYDALSGARGEIKVE